MNMRIYLIDDKKIDIHVLPSKLDSSFLMHYSSLDDDSDNIITIEAEDNKWVIKSNGNINVIMNQKIVEEAPLVHYSFYYLKITGQNKYLLLYVAPLNESELYTLDCSDLNSFTVGKGQTSNIMYNNSLIDDIQCEFIKSENGWNLVSKGTKSKIFVNNEAITNTLLKIGDVVFISGFKIIWMNSFIVINNPNKSVKVSGMKPYIINDRSNNYAYEEVSDEESSIELYNEDDYFFHTPRIREKIESVEIKIDAPPNKEYKDDIPFIFSIGTMITMIASSFVNSYTVITGLLDGTTTLSKSMPRIIMIVAMLIGSIIIPRLMNRYNRKKKEKREELRQEKYTAYLKEKRTKIEDELKKQTQILFANNLSSYECANLILKNDSRLWCRQIEDNDFLDIRLGIGNKPAELVVEAPQEQFTLDEDNLFQEVYKIVDETKILKDVPITFSLLEKTNISFVFNSESRDKYINNIVTQLITYHSANDLKIVILTNKKHEKFWEYTKFLPHCWSDNKSIRFFATNQEELQVLSSYIEEEYKNRKEKIKSGDKDGESNIDKNSGFKNFSPYYLIFCDNYKTIKKESMVDMLLKSDINVGFTFITIANSTRNLPSSCDTFIQIGEKDGGVIGKEIDSQKLIKFRLDAMPDFNMAELSIKLLNKPILSKDEITGLPSVISFLEMYSVSKIEQLNILNRWKNSNPVLSLAAPIGVKTNGELFMLDLHEKYHGPHGLIAGSTGSGKSEFIITYILSMAVTYHPYEVQFVLIDYKGGGLTGAFENKETGVHIPHLAGTLTNLDTSEINRALVSIESELKRRQRIFNEVKDSLDESTIDIYKYQKLYREGLVKEPLAHLFIICDEFAELKSQRPEFMDQLITTARIGRSLGLHLILATQKPSGVVNDQIWSNSKFKICFKVQDRSDSMEMLKKPDAASLRDVGRFYLQVGYDDYYDIGQSAWGGAKYIPTNRIIKKTDNSINFVNNVGYAIKTINDHGKENRKKENDIKLGDQLTNTVKYIYNLSINEELKERKLWFDIIPEKIFISDLIKKYNHRPIPYYINPVIGEYDKPAKQEQGMLNLDLTNNGNTLIYGKPGSGKEMLLSTIIWSCAIEHSPAEVSFYIIDCGAEVLKMFEKFPHVGEIATVDESEKIANIFNMVSDELKERKELFADYAGSYINYCENSGQKLPLIIVIINSYDIFIETYSKLADGVQSFYRDCIKYGIIFIVSTSTTNTVRSRIAQNFSNKISLQLPNDDDYRVVIPNAPRGLIPGKYYGRGIIDQNGEVFEFQTAFIYEQKELNNVIKQANEVLNTRYQEKAKKIITVPAEVTLDLVINEMKDLDGVPIGYDMATKEIYKYNFIQNNINMVLSNTIDDKMPFIYGLAKEIKNIANLMIVDFINSFNISIDGVPIFKDNFDKALVSINNQLRNDESNSKKNVYILVGLGKYIEKLPQELRPVVNNIFNNVSNFKSNIFIFVDEYNSYKKVQLEPWYSTQVNTSSGIWLGEGIGSQIAIETIDITPEIRKQNFTYMGYAVNRGKLTTIKCLFDKEE